MLAVFPMLYYISWRAWQPTPVFLPGESRRLRSLVGYNPEGHKESKGTEATERATHEKSLSSLLSQPSVLTASCWLSLVCQEVSLMHLQHPHYLCSLLLINSLPSEILCVWKFFSSPHSGCPDRSQNSSP